MDAALSEVCNPHLERVLRTFQAAANTSLCGPGGSLPAGWQAAPASPRPGVAASLPLLDVATSYRVGGVLSSLKTVNGAATASTTSFDFKTPRSVRASPQMPPPILIPPDRSASDKSQTTLESETIACFIVGGEKRLCLPQILNTVLRDFTLPQIDKACEELHIYCSRCSPEQLNAFKVAGVLPTKAPSCGLITKTDAERLCNALLHEPRYAAAAAAARRRPEDGDDARLAPPGCSIRVYHKCFGKAFGLLYPDAYVSDTARFIECSDCRQLMTARRFVCHTHSDQENRIVHWGFDSDRWRAYVQLDKAQGNLDQMEATLSAVKARFSDRPRKRHLLDRERKDCGEESFKRARGAQLNAEPPASADLRRAGDRSAFHRWAPEASPEDLTKDAAARAIAAAAIAGARAAASAPVPAPPESPASSGSITITRCSPPVLADPRRVVPLSEADRYGKHFVPNVSLAPPQQQQQALKLKLESDSVKDDCDESKVEATTPGVHASGDDNTSSCHLQPQSVGVAQEVLKSVSAMSSIFAEALRHASPALDDRRRLRLEETFADHRARLEHLVRETAGPTLVPVTKKLLMQASAIAAACGSSAIHDGRD